MRISHKFNFELTLYVHMIKAGMYLDVYFLVAVSSFF